ncbi:MAG: metallophosphoesterase [Syntrophobacterales bacterium]|nr:metallophosphoesterase [Syntrophobacterales bacterium]
MISDTHGKLEIINELAGHVRADVVIHAGDFGFCDDGSLERLSYREIRMHVVHSDLQQTDKERILALSRADMMKAAMKYRLLGEFQSFLNGKESFQVPVYAVWGNHEDRDVVERLFRGEAAVENLHILHHRQGYRVGPAFVYGLGGNLLPGSKMMQRPIAGGGGKIWSTLSQYADLVKTVEKNAEPTGPRIFVSHVSPGKEPFVELVGTRTRTDFTISVHMGAQTCMVWNPFAVSTFEEAEKRLQAGFDVVNNACVDKAEPDISWAAEAFTGIFQINIGTFLTT